MPPLRRQRRDLPRNLGRGIDLALRPRPKERGTIDELRATLKAAKAEVGDTPGIVTGGADPQAHEADNYADSYADSYEDDCDYTDDGEAPADSRPTSSPWPERALAAIASAAATAWLTTHLATPAPVPAPLAGLIAAAAVILAPRLGYVALAAALSGLAATHHHGGAAFVLPIAALIPVLLNARRGTTWPLAAGAPALAALTIPTAWPAVAARAQTPWRRATLGATGYVWAIVLADNIRAHQTAPAAGWSGSPHAAIHHLLVPILTSQALVGAGIWAVAALMLPYLLANVSLTAKTVLTAIWAATLTAATAQVADVHVAALGGVAAAIVALAPTVLRTRAIESWRRNPDSLRPVP